MILSSTRAFSVALLALTYGALVHSFVPQNAPSSPSSTRLHLVPEQGKQLVAAFNAASAAAAAAAQAKEVNGSTIVPAQEAANMGVGVVSTAKAVVSRIFSIPGAILGRDAAAALVDLWPRVGGEEEDDVVYYPLVGFQFVKGQKNDMVSVVPTTSNPSCRIANLPDQEVFGWYCSSCQLDSIYSDTYCDEPIVTTTGEQQ